MNNKIKRQPISLSDHFTYPRLLRFVVPSIIMMIFTSIYSVVDGWFVSNYVGKTQFAAVNLSFPFLMVVGALGFMIGTGGSAIVARTLGEGDNKRANEIFSMLIYVTLALGITVSVLGYIFAEPIVIMLGAEGEMIGYCVTYSRIILIANTAFMLQNCFQSFLVTAEKPKLGLAVTVAAGVTNMVLDFVLVALLEWGIAGAAIATALSQCVGGLLPFFYFCRKNSSLLRLTRARLDFKVLLQTVTNGSSELMSNISASIVTMLYNFQLLHFAGENGVAAYGAIMYVNFIFVAIYIGYAIGSAPIFGYNYGAENVPELQNVFRKSIQFNVVVGVIMTALALSLSKVIAGIFVGYDEVLFNMTVRGFRIYAFSFLICGISIFGSSMFTALSNGLISALISFLRTLVFQTAAVLILPMIWKLDGVWLSVVAAEVMSILLTLLFIVIMRKRYKYY